MPTEADPDGDPDPIDLDFDLDRALRVRAIRAADRLEAITGEPYDAGEALTKGLDLLEAKLDRFEPADSNATGTGEGRLIEDGGVEMVEVCPECGSTQVMQKVKTGKPHREHPEPYYCGKTGCYAHFEEPATVADAPGAGELAACPECDGHEIVLRTGKDNPDIEPGTWRCQNPECGAIVAEPARRPRHNPGGEPGPIGQILADADPDADFEDLRSDDPEPITDGGREQCVVCAHPYDRAEHDRCPNCEHASLDEFATDGGHALTPDERAVLSEMGQLVRMECEHFDRRTLAANEFVPSIERAKRAAEGLVEGGYATVADGAAGEDPVYRLTDAGCVAALRIEGDGAAARTDGGRDRERPADLPFRLPGQAETFAGPGDGYPSALRGERDG